MSHPVSVVTPVVAPCAPRRRCAQVLVESEAATLPVAGFEDHAVPIGRMEDGVRRV
jgi:hypothetical protein